MQIRDPLEICWAAARNRTDISNCQCKGTTFFRPLQGFSSRESSCIKFHKVIEDYLTQKSRKSQKFFALQRLHAVLLSRRNKGNRRNDRFALLCAARAKGTFCDFRDFCVTIKISIISFISAGLKKHSFSWLYAEFFVPLQCRRTSHIYVSKHKIIRSHGTRDALLS